MSTVIKLKKSSVSGLEPDPNNLEYGELAINYNDGKLYFRTNTNTLNYFPSISQTEAFLPDQTNNSGKVLSTDGTTASWVNNDSLYAYAIYTKYAYTATASQTTFSVPSPSSTVDVYLNGIKLTNNDFSIVNDTVVLTSPANLDDLIEILNWRNVTTTIDGYDFVPDRTNHAGEVLTTNGIDATWSNTLNLSGSFSAASINSTPIGAITPSTGSFTTLNTEGPSVISVNSSSDALRITQTGTGNALMVEDSANPDSTPVVIDGNGKVVIGFTSANSILNGVTNSFQILGTSGSTSGFVQARFSNDVSSAPTLFYKSRATTINGTGIVQNNDVLGQLSFLGDDGATYAYGAAIQAAVDGTPGTNDMPGRLVFSTTADGANTPTERIRIDSSGTVFVRDGTSTINTNSSKLVVDGTISETVGGTQYLVVSQYDLGTAPNEIPLNQYLGNLAYQDANAIAGNVAIGVNSSSDALRITQTGAGNALVVEDSANPDSTPVVIDSSGNTIFGNTTTFDVISPQTGTAASTRLQYASTSGANNSTFAISNWSTSGTSVAGGIVFAKSKSGTVGTQTGGIVAINDRLGLLDFQGSDGTSFVRAARIEAEVDGTPGTNDMPGRLVFSTTADGASTPTERVRIDSAGKVTIAGELAVGGNLTVNGTTTTVNSTIVTLDDPILTLGGDTAPTVDDNKDRGVEFRWHNGTAAKVGFFGFDDSTGYLTFIPDATNSSEVFSGTLGDIQATNFRGDLIGNASTANAWATGRTITLGGDLTGSVSIDGSANVTLTATVAANSVALGTDTTGNYVAGNTAGSYILVTGTAGEGWSPTIAVDATSANTASKVVARDASGNFSAGTITASLSGNATTATTATNQSGGTVNATTGSFSSTLSVTGTTTVDNYINRTTASGNSAWMQQDGTGRIHWYWNTFGGNSPTFTNGNEDAAAASLTANNGGAGGAFFTRSASGVGKSAGDPITWTTTLYADLNTFSYKGNTVLRSDNYNSYAPTLTGTGASGTWGISITGNAATATTASATSATLTRGSYLTGSNFNGSAATTWAVDATTTATASKVVARDANGYIYAVYFTAAGTFPLPANALASGMGTFTGTNGTDSFGRGYTPAAAAALLSGQSMNIAGNASTVTNGVYTNTTQTISGVTTFTNGLIASNESADGTIPTLTKFGRSASQYVSFYGNASGNRLISVSTSSNPKEFSILVTDSVTTGSFDFSRAGVLSATTFSGSLSGNATTATNIDGYSGTYWTSNNDGSGSGLDADTLDGQQGSYYQPASTAVTTTTIANWTLNPKFATSIGFGNDDAILYYNDSTNETLTNYWSAKDGFEIRGDSGNTNNVVLKTGNLYLGQNGYVAGKLGVAGQIDAGSLSVIGAQGSIEAATGIESWYVSDNFSVAADESEPRDLAFSSDGTKMYIVGNSGNDITQYTLSTAWSVSTAGSPVVFSIASQEGSPYGLDFKPDGTEMYVAGTTGDNIYQYTLSSAWDITSASYTRTFTVTSQESDPNAVYFKPDGTKMYVIGTSGDDVNEYNLSTAWDISTATYSTVYSISAYETGPQALSFSSDGTKFWVAGTTYNRIAEFTMSTPWSVATASFNDYVNLYYVQPDETTLYTIGGMSGLYVNEAVGKAWVSDYNTDRVFELTINSATTKFTGNKFSVESQLCSIKNSLIVNRNLKVNGEIRQLGAAYFGAAYAPTFNGQSGSSTLSVGTSTSSGAFNIATGLSSGVFTLGGTATTGTMTIDRSASAHTLNIATGANASGVTKTINIGGSGASGSITNINIGSSVSGSTGTVNIYSNTAITGAVTATGGFTEGVAGLASSGTLSLLSSLGTIVYVYAAGTITFTDNLSTGQSVTLRLTGGSTYTINWPTITWVTSAGNTAPTLTADDTLIFWKIGSTLFGAYVGSAA